MVESEKAAFEVAAEEDGVLLRQDVAAGDQARVLEPIAWIGAAGGGSGSGGYRGSAAGAGGSRRTAIGRESVVPRAGIRGRGGNGAGRRPPPLASGGDRARSQGAGAGSSRGSSGPAARAAAGVTHGAGSHPSRHFRGGPAAGACTRGDRPGPEAPERLRGPCPRGRSRLPFRPPAWRASSSWTWPPCADRVREAAWCAATCSRRR